MELNTKYVELHEMLTQFETHDIVNRDERYLPRMVTGMPTLHISSPVFLSR